MRMPLACTDVFSSPKIAQERKMPHSTSKPMPAYHARLGMTWMTSSRSSGDRGALDCPGDAGCVPEGLGFCGGLDVGSTDDVADTGALAGAVAAAGAETAGDAAEGEPGAHTQPPLAGELAGFPTPTEVAAFDPAPAPVMAEYAEAPVSVTAVAPNGRPAGAVAEATTLPAEGGTIAAVPLSDSAAGAKAVCDRGGAGGLS